MKVTVLGCGTSTGVPLIGCRCAVCTSGEPKNRRRRCAVFIEAGARRILIDTPPDLRCQCLDAGIDRLDAVLYTHAHADHVNGIDDLRSFNHLMDRPLPAYGHPTVLERIRERFAYAFLPPVPDKGWFRPCLEPQPVEAPFEVGGVPVRPFELQHGHAPSWGFRIGGLAYAPDVDGLTDRAKAEIRGADVWIVDCLRERPHPSHAHLARTLAWIEELAPARAVLTHMSHELDYHELRGKLPPGVEPAYDGMVLELAGP